MSKRCLHPACVETIPAHQVCCGRHWSRVPALLVYRYKMAGSIEARGAVGVEIRSHFESRMHGPHELVECSGKTCKADIIFLTTRAGRLMPVDADSVSVDDFVYEHQRHMPHFATCVDRKAFKKAGAV